MPGERLPWPQMIGFGMQHVVAMFGATFLVPLLTGFSPSTTILFSGIGTLIFLIVTKGRVPSYLGSSFAFISPVIASMGADKNIALALGGIAAAGAMLVVVGVIVDRAGYDWINRLMPPAVTGAIVALIGLNLAGVATKNVTVHWGYAAVTLTATVLSITFLRGFLGRIAILIGVIIGWVVSALTGGLDAKAVQAVWDAPWFGLPEFNYPQFTLGPVLLMLPVVFVLIAENTGHVKAVAEMTRQPLDASLGKAYTGDGIATMVAAFFGGSGTTTYGENIGVMAATRIYSTAAYVVAGVTAIALGLVPKFGMLILTMPLSVLGGVTLVLYGMIAMMGFRIWVDKGVNFHRMDNLVPAAVALIAGSGNLTWAPAEGYTFEGISMGTVLILVLYHFMHRFNSSRDRVELYEEAPVVRR